MLAKNYRFEQIPTSKRIASTIYQLIKRTYELPSNWTEIGFYNDLQSEMSRYFGAFDEEKLIACLGLQTVLTEATITNIAVDRLYQKQGVARALWHFAKEQLSDTNALGVVFLEVRLSNLAAQRFYEAAGFECYAIRPNYYTKPVEDAKLYRLQLTSN